ncbi:unnamed protein product [Nesidiocoris tenuis]|uniref:Uncharacterized protein n=1 Tax=Nesidiocoris tenuis TaxID=355587 RepID=A0A6H5G4J9_9HEMI|nr:unnamed protein product [Nesidiocoris tenuis]
MLQDEFGLRVWWHDRVANPSPASPRGWKCLLFMRPERFSVARDWSSGQVIHYCWVRCDIEPGFPRFSVRHNNSPKTCIGYTKFCISMAIHHAASSSPNMLKVQGNLRIVNDPVKSIEEQGTDQTGVKQERHRARPWSSLVRYPIGILEQAAKTQNEQSGILWSRWYKSNTNVPSAASLARSSKACSQVASNIIGYTAANGINPLKLGRRFMPLRRFSNKHIWSKHTEVRSSVYPPAELEPGTSCPMVRAYRQSHSETESLDSPGDAIAFGKPWFPKVVHQICRIKDFSPTNRTVLIKPGRNPPLYV